MFFFLSIRPAPRPTLFPYTTLFRSVIKRLLSRDEVTSVVNACDAGREGELRSEEHTSELQSHSDLVCRLLLEKKKQKRRVDAVPGRQSRGIQHGDAATRAGCAIDQE